MTVTADAHWTLSRSRNGGTVWRGSRGRDDELLEFNIQTTEAA
jgi:hypothetical protein